MAKKARIKYDGARTFDGGHTKISLAYSNANSVAAISRQNIRPKVSGKIFGPNSSPLDHVICYCWQYGSG